MSDTLAPNYRMDTRELQILEHFERDPDITQPTLAAKLGVAVGTVNWYVKRLISKGYVKVTRLQRKRLRYLLTPKGIAEKTRLTVAYLEQSMSVYRQVRKQARELVEKLHQEGYDKVTIEGKGDLADVVRLTCLEQGVEPVAPAKDGTFPTIHIVGLRLELIPQSGVILETKP